MRRLVAAIALAFALLGSATPVAAQTGDPWVDGQVRDSRYDTVFDWVGYGSWQSEPMQLAGRYVMVWSGVNRDGLGGFIGMSMVDASDRYRGLFSFAYAGLAPYRSAGATPALSLEPGSYRLRVTATGAEWLAALLRPKAD